MEPPEPVLRSMRYFYGRQIAIHSSIPQRAPPSSDAIQAICGKLKTSHADISSPLNSPYELLEVDYPSASFGTQNLAAGAEGPLAIVIADAGISWQPAPTVAAGK